MAVRVEHLNIENQTVPDLDTHHIDGLHALLEALRDGYKSREGETFLTLNIRGLRIVRMAIFIFCNRSGDCSTSFWRSTVYSKLLFFSQLCDNFPEFQPFE